MARRADRTLNSEVSCLICSEGVSKKPVKLPSPFGSSSLVAFNQICGLLKVPFAEVKDDWSFGGSGDGENLPFCSLCLTGLHAVLKLEQQIVNIQKKIQEKIDTIREKIRKSSNTAVVEDLKIVTFRSKALLYYDPTKNCRPTENPNPATIPASINNTGNYTYSVHAADPPPSWSPRQPLLPPTTTNTSLQNSQQYSWLTPTSSHAQKSVPIPKAEATPVTTASSESQNYYNDFDDDEPAADDDNYSESDNEEDEDQDYEYEVKTTSKKPAPKSRAKQTRNKLQVELPNFTPTSRRSAAASSERQRQPEYFSPTTTDPNGRMVFEGIVITPVSGKGYMCGHCNAIVGKNQTSVTLRKTKIHIKGFHLGAYKCPLCNKSFTSNDILNQHHFFVHEKIELPCIVCGKVLQERSMKPHLYSHMNAEEKEACIQSGYYKPKTSNLEPSHPCRICGKLFIRQSTLRKHELTHVSAEFRRDFKCEYCPRAFTDEQARRNHVTQHHQTLNARKRLCKVCGQSVYHKMFSTHMKSHNRFQCKVCEKVFAREDTYNKHAEKCGKPRLRVKPEEGTQGRVECDICYKDFSTRKIMLQHRTKSHKSHWKLKVPTKFNKDLSVENPKGDPVDLDDLNNEGIQHVEGNIYSYQLYELEKLSDGGYKCCTCSVELREGEALMEELVKDHVKSMHIGSFRCNKCSKRMKTLFEAEAHLRSEHGKRNSYDCDICGRSAIPNKGIKKHTWLHRSLWEMAEAVNAGETFPENYKKWETQEILKGMGVEVNLKCVVCEKDGFDSLEDLYNHRRGEHPDARVLKIMKRKVTGVRPKVKPPDGPVDCPDCGKTCENTKKMRNHRYKVHLKRKKPRPKPPDPNKPLDCPDCGKTCGNPRKMRDHRYQVHRKRKSTVTSGVEGSSEKKSRARRNIKVEAEEDTMDSFGDVEIKGETFTPSNSEDEGEDEYFGGGGSANSSSDDNEDELEDKYQIKKSCGEGETGPEERRRSLRDRSSLRRNSYKNMNYAEEEEGEDDSDK